MLVVLVTKDPKECVFFSLSHNLPFMSDWFIFSICRNHKSTQNIYSVYSIQLLLYSFHLLTEYTYVLPANVY